MIYCSTTDTEFDTDCQLMLAIYISIKDGKLKL